tara:strand:- start:2847 stop:3731 length:885 start_codon:yes stop_codon:yes gene_type:complete
MLFNTKQTLKQIISLVADALDQASLFYGHGTDNAWDEACWLVETLIQKSGLREIKEDMLLEQAILDQVQQILDRRINEKIPLAYLLQEAWFAGSAFYVDERVIVPRSPFAELIENRFEPLISGEPERILDLCCGSACIGLATAMIFPQSRVELSDLSSEALEVAAINVSRHDLGKRVSLSCSDLFQALNGPYELILSNPPYVGIEEYQDLPAEFKQEPAMALLSEQRGLAIPVKILQQAADYLSDSGLLIMEVGNSWQALADLYPDAPFLWLEFEQGGEGICVLNKKQLESYRF